MHGNIFGWHEWRRNGFIGQKGWLLILFGLYDKEMTGSEIMGLVEKETSGMWKLSPSLVYPYLRELKLSGYLESTEREGKIYYKLSEKGRALIDQATNFFPGWRIRYEMIKQNYEPESVINNLEDSVQYLLESSDKTKLDNTQKEKIRKLIDKLTYLLS